MLAATLLFGMGLVACGNQGNSNGKQQTTSSVPARPKINATAPGDKKTVELEIDGEVQLTADQADVAWKSSDEKVATVDQTGKVKAIASGSATITASKEGYTSGSVSITVRKPAALGTLKMEDADHYAADGWWGTGDDGSTPLYARTSGNASDAQCIAHMDNGDKETLTFASDKAIKAELVVMMASRIDIKAGDNVLLFEFKASAPYMDDVMLYSKEAATITAKPAAAKDAIVITNTELAVTEGETLQLTGAPAGARYVSSDETKATVDENGLVSAVAKGSVAITVIKEGMLSARVSITVNEKVVEGSFLTEFEAGEQEGAAITFKDATGGYRVTNAFPQGETLTVPINAPKAGKFTMIFVARIAYSVTFDGNLASAFEIKLNGNAVSTSVTLNGNSWTEYTIADVDLNNGPAVPLGRNGHLKDGELFVERDVVYYAV